MLVNQFGAKIPAAGGGGVISFSDDFNRSDRLIAGDNGWLGTYGTMQIVSNELVSYSGNNSVCYRNDGIQNGIFTFDITYGFGTFADYLIIRGNTTISSVIDGYIVGMDGAAIKIYEGNGSSYTQKVSKITDISGTNPTVRVVVTDNGSNISAVCTNLSTLNEYDISFDTTIHNDVPVQGFRIYGAQSPIDNYSAVSI